jgi:ubiquinone/menaquinone biosynthesis C-methylase UbiE
MAGGPRLIMPKNDCLTYVMGATEHERRRLLLQSSILNPLTEDFLKKAGISVGMRVLDLGCGIGDVSLIVARLVGPHGSVTGLDRDGAALEAARARADEEDLSQVTFEQTAFEDYHSEYLYDAIVGRHVLIHTPDPLGWIQKSTSLLCPGGIAAFQEYDLSYFPRAKPELPLFHELSEYLVTLFRRVAAYADTGKRLYHWMHRVGLSPTYCQASCLMSGGRDSPFYEWLAETLRSVTPHLEQLGIVSAADLDVDTLADRLQAEAVSRGGPVTTPLIVSCAGRSCSR